MDQEDLDLCHANQSTRISLALILILIKFTSKKRISTIISLSANTAENNSIADLGAVQKVYNLFFVCCRRHYFLNYRFVIIKIKIAHKF